ncbi:MAG: hypothetical protein ACLGI9_14500 [Thermoanaerobaculia bacterium]
MSDRAKALRVLAALKRSPVGDSAVLVGSSGLFGFETGVPALTEDVDVSIPESLAEQQGRAIVESLIAQGFEHEPGTATFTDPEGIVFDLLGHGDPEAGDHIGGTEALHVMVFEDLSRLLKEAVATMDLPQGGRALTPAGFVASKLLTERAHKGAKDKIQALLVLAERQGDQNFMAEVARLLHSAGPLRLDDVRAGAQTAFLSLERDPTFSDAGAEGYAPVLKQAEIGLEQLFVLLDSPHG